MRKIVAALACLGIAGAVSAPAGAGVVVSVGVPSPVVAPPALVTPWPYAYVGPRYPGYVRFGYPGPYGYRPWVRPGPWGYARWHGWR
jgi:hypothetical protein